MSTAHTTLQPYLFFNGRCHEALDFYANAVGAKILMLMRFNDSPEPHPPGMLPAGWEEKVMHASVSVGGSTLMASDGNCAGATEFDGFSIALTVATEAEAEQAFNALVQGGTVKMPLTKTFWSPKFGMLEDRFGLGWMVSVAHEPK